MKKGDDKCRTCRYNAMLMGYAYHKCDYATMNWPRVKLKDFPGGPWRGPHCAAYDPMDPKKKRKARRVSEPIGKAMQTDRAEYKRKAAAICEQMRVLYAQGKSDAEIGREIGRSKSTVRRWRQKSCLPAQEHEGTT